MIQFPIAPQQVNPKITEPSALYKQEVFKSIAVIILFILTYFVLVACAITLAYLCIKLGIGILGAVSGILPWLAAAGIILIGLFTLYFIFKFIFSSYKTDKSALVEIKAEDQPQLFAFIKKITEETQAPFPKKIFLSNEVNASVFYDSSFLSMFLPVKKNLLIGLGLVNAVTLSEFKAILAHEFGHFSQRSMKVGSYVYNANRIIHNLLYDNGGFYNTLNGIAGVHVVLYFCMQIVSGVVKAIQYVLNRMYLFMNKQNLKLSREMEFHADSVAASVAGSKPLVDSLYRLELAESSFSQTLEICDLILADGRQEQNIYPHHTHIMNSLAKEYKIPMTNNLAQINKNTFSNFQTARVSINDQWASHPSTPDREAALIKLNIQAETNEESAWTLFQKVEDLQKQMTQMVYDNAQLNDKPNDKGHYITSKYEEQKLKYRILDNEHSIWEEMKLPKLNLELDENMVFEYNNEVKNKSAILNGLLQDELTLEAIMKKEVKVASFDFDGNKYRSKMAETVLETIKLEKKKLEEEIEEQNKRAILFEYKNAFKENKHVAFSSHFQKCYDLQIKQAEFMIRNEFMINTLQPLFNGEEISIEGAQSISLKLIKEETLIKELINDSILSEEINENFTEKMKTSLHEFVDASRVYFTSPNFLSDHIHALIQDLNLVNNAYNELIFFHKKKMINL